MEKITVKTLKVGDNFSINGKEYSVIQKVLETAIAVEIKTKQTYQFPQEQIVNKKSNA